MPDLKKRLAELKSLREQGLLSEKAWDAACIAAVVPPPPPHHGGPPPPPDHHHKHGPHHGKPGPGGHGKHGKPPGGKDKKGKKDKKDKHEQGASAAEALAAVEHVPPRQGASMLGVPFEKTELVRIGWTGVGGRGTGLLKEMLAVPGCQIVAIFDPVPDNAEAAADIVAAAGQPRPSVEAEHASLCQCDVDLVYIASRWDDHVPHAVAAMEAGKHCAVEVPAATTLEQCWELVDVSERTRRHCVQLENCCYGESEMMALQMVKAGLFGSINHGEASYIHDLRGELLRDAGEGLWRREPHKTRNGNFYPTHGLGPVARYMDLNRSDVMSRLVSMSSPSASMQLYRDERAEGGDASMIAKRSETYVAGDINTSLIQTAAGRTIMLQHDVVSPRPYTRHNLISGSKGTFADFPARIFVDAGATGSMSHDWQDIESYKAEYSHPLWREYGQQAIELGGHGGMDYILNLRLIQCFQQGVEPDINVYDAAAWSAPGPLSEISVAHDGLSLPFPDFTRGGWTAAAPAPAKL